MPEKIGKYEILGRIGRGGMGTVFKAHDPVLDRPVALKVISSEVEVTDELRARFFREAQACARLSHRNIVTVYDIGEDKGRLFIVMELVEGVELRRLIAERAVLTLEDKLSVMRQVCDGLHYAHQKGIVHRDIKPGNILLQRNGQVKILDFGIARVANAVGDLTRTGLIMGTLRYIAPEQVRGRADHRSDIFSVGAVFYELLSWRPPFTGENPIELLEQLRTEEPLSLSQLAPGLPPELAGIVHQAMRKDPAERFDDLAQMKVEIEQVQRGLAEEAQRVRSRVQGQQDQLRALQAALTERIGGAVDGEPLPTPPEQDSLAALQALERDLAGQIEQVQAKIGRAEALAAAVQRGMELLEAGQFADATVEFEAIVASMPDHVRALEGLRRARTAAETQRREHLAARLVQDACAALAEGDYALCLEILNQAAELPPPPEAARDIDSLRRSAEGALATEQAVREARECAERARYEMAQARRTAEAQATPQQAPALWAEAEAKVAEGPAALKSQAYAEAAPRQECAPAADVPSVTSVSEPPDASRGLGTQGPGPTGDSNATRLSSGLPALGDARSTGLWPRPSTSPVKDAGRPRVILARGIVVAVGALVLIAVAIFYGLPRSMPLRSPPTTQTTPEPRASTPPAPRPAEPLDLEKAEATRPELPPREKTDTRVVERRPTDRTAWPSAPASGAVASRPRDPEDSGQAKAAAARARQDAEQARARVASARRAAEQAAAGFYAHKLFAAAQTKEQAGAAALMKSDYGEAIRLLGEVQSDYQAAAQEARREAEAERQLAPLRASLEQARVSTASGRARALTAGADRLAKDHFEEAQVKHVEADGLATRQNLTAAAQAYREAAERYADAAVRAQAVRQTK